MDVISMYIYKFMINIIDIIMKQKRKKNIHE